MSELRWEFERWLRHTVPWQLNLSPSKQVAMQLKFYHFSDWVSSLEKKAPTEFRDFFEKLQAEMAEVSKWKAPKGTCVVPSEFNDQLLEHPNGKLKYRLVDK